MTDFKKELQEYILEKNIKAISSKFDEIYHSGQGREASDDEVNRFIDEGGFDFVIINEGQLELFNDIQKVNITFHHFMTTAPFSHKLYFFF